MAAMPAAQNELKKIREAFLEYRYYPLKEVQEAFYLEHMFAEELAAALDLLAQEFDYKKVEVSVLFWIKLSKIFKTVDYTHERL